MGSSLGICIFWCMYWVLTIGANLFFSLKVLESDIISSIGSSYLFFVLLSWTLWMLIGIAGLKKLWFWESLLIMEFIKLFGISPWLWLLNINVAPDLRSVDLCNSLSVLNGLSLVEAILSWTLFEIADSLSSFFECSLCDIKTISWVLFTELYLAVFSNAKKMSEKISTSVWIQ